LLFDLHYGIINAVRRGQVEMEREMKMVKEQAQTLMGLTPMDYGDVTCLPYCDRVAKCTVYWCEGDDVPLLSSEYKIRDGFPVCNKCADVIDDEAFDGVSQTVTG
jgi:hypothetical protein